MVEREAVRGAIKSETYIASSGTNLRASRLAFSIKRAAGEQCERHGGPFGTSAARKTIAYTFIRSPLHGNMIDIVLIVMHSNIKDIGLEGSDFAWPFPNCEPNKSS
ncbi:hypothetical protein HUJ04_013160 [Dendroctonus ponderosae]|nr:hypothetical protein HUJ04_013160 [Dendroctonus ponderosae]KAH1006554.1 hypothetical protein HUJ05_007278 [Dendroctonus ponderosae]